MAGINNAGDPCPICGGEVVVITRETYRQMIEILQPGIRSIPKSFLRGKAPLLPICPQCDKYALGAELKEPFPFLDKEGKIGTVNLCINQAE
jgi:endogenous inhibitor of DNA gyrase (YacG/DUF329 family)